VPIAARDGASRDCSRDDPTVRGGTWNPVTVRGTAPATGSALARIGVTDIAGNTTECPAVALIGQRSTQAQDIRIDRVNGTSHQLLIINGTLGLSKLTIVNGRPFQSVNLANGSRLTIDLAPALQAGTNSLSLVSVGPTGSHEVAIVRCLAIAQGVATSIG
jgi:hypothetical protein